MTNSSSTEIRRRRASRWYPRRYLTVWSITSILIVLLLLIFGGLYYSSDPEPYGTATDHSDWTLQASDEFDHDILNSELWSDSEDWQRGGFADGDAWVPQPTTPENLAIKDGTLAVRAVPAPGSPDSKRFTTAQLNTRGHQMFTIDAGALSYVEFRAQLPSSPGLLPALWLLGDGTAATGDGWPINGEIDLVEFANNQTGAAGRPYSSIVFPKDVYTKPPGSFLNRTQVTMPESQLPRPDLQSGWHVWGLERGPDHMTMYIDGKPFWTVRPGETVDPQYLPIPAVVFRSQMHIRMGITVGGNWAADGVALDEIRGGELLVDYVRLWTSSDSGTSQ